MNIKAELEITIKALERSLSKPVEPMRATVQAQLGWLREIRKRLDRDETYNQEHPNPQRLDIGG